MDIRNFNAKRFLLLIPKIKPFVFLIMKYAANSITATEHNNKLLV